MLDTTPPVVPLRLNNSARLASSLVIAWSWVHVVGAINSWTWDLRVGFWPIWYGDCVMCSGPAVVPYGLPIIGGVGIFAAVGIGLSLVLVSSRFSRSWQPALQISAGLACAIHAIYAVTERFPGTLPKLILGSGAPVLAAGLFALSYLRGFGLDRSFFSSSRPTRTSLWFVIAAVISQLLMGGVWALVAIGVGIKAFPKRESMADVAMLTLGWLHILMGLGGRYSIVTRFDHLVDYLWI